jgi:hypothetical protein
VTGAHECVTGAQECVHLDRLPHRAPGMTGRVQESGWPEGQEEVTAEYGPQEKVEQKPTMGLEPTTPRLEV